MNNKQIAAQIREAAALISKPGSWTQGALARNKDGESVSAWDAQATCRCALGALSAVDRPHGSETRTQAQWILRSADYYYEPDLVGFNDELGRTQDEVLTALCLVASVVESGGL